MVAKTFELSLKEVIALQKAAIKHSFATAIEKKRMKQIITEFEAFYRNKLILKEKFRRIAAL